MSFVALRSEATRIVLIIRNCTNMNVWLCYDNVIQLLFIKCQSALLQVRQGTCQSVKTLSWNFMSVYGLTGMLGCCTCASVSGGLRGRQGYRRGVEGEPRAAAGGRAAISKRCARAGEVSRRTAARRQRCYPLPPSGAFHPYLLPNTHSPFSHDHRRFSLAQHESKPKGRRYWHLSALWH